MPLLVYKSSAGSGKTFTLVKEYLKIVLNKPTDYKRILAITFTNKATEEMKQRILSELRKIILGTSEMQGILTDELRQPLPHLQQQAEKALNNVLHDYSRFEISTIDSFFSRVIRSFAKELQLPFRYDVELEVDIAIEQAIIQLIDKVHKDEQLHQWLLTFALSRLEDDNGWNIEYSIKNIALDIFNENVFSWIKDAELSFNTLTQVINDCKKVVNNFETELKKNAQKVVDFIAKSNLERTDFSGGKNSVLHRFYNWAEGSTQEPTNTLLKILAGEKDWYAQTSPKKHQIQFIENQLTLLAADAVDYYQTNIPVYNTCKIILKNIYAYGVLSLINRELINYRTDNNLMLMADANFMLHEAIGNADAPFVYEKIGSFYTHIFIDEFQDTSTNQWHNLKPLVYNSMANGGTVFIVGDVKQSIYRWRGGNLNLLLNDLENEFKPQFPSDFSNKVLNTNYRSYKTIVEFNNNFFKQLTQHLSTKFPEITSIEQAYDSVHQLSHKHEEGYVEIQFFNSPSKNNELIKPWKEQALEKTQQVINSVIQNGYGYSDIMLLVLRNAEATELAEFLENSAIPIISQKSLLVKNSLHIKCLIAALKIILNPHDSLAKTILLHRLGQINNQPINNFDQTIEVVKNNEHPFFNKIFTVQFISNLKGRSLFEIIEECCILLSFQTSANPYIHFLFDQIIELQGRGILSISAFLIWWDEKQDRLNLSTPENINAVSILTVHQAKGLEKPIVICPFMVDSSKMGKSLIWTNDLPQQLENFGIFPVKFDLQLENSLFSNAFYTELEAALLDQLNVLYVAFTRPAHQLYVFTKVPSQTKSSKPQSPIKTYNFLLYNLLKDNVNNGVYKVGSPTHNAQPDKGSTTHFIKPEQETSVLPKINLRNNTQNYFKLFNNNAGKKVREGLQLHALLEKVNHKNQVKFLIEQMLFEGLITQADVTPLEQKIYSLFENQQFASWFTNDWHVLTEREIYSNGKTYKPDRVIYSQQKAIIIDYKKEQQSSQHQKQIKHYGSLLQKMSFNNIEKYLVYTESLAIVRVE